MLESDHRITFDNPSRPIWCRQCGASDHDQISMPTSDYVVGEVRIVQPAVGDHWQSGDAASHRSKRLSLVCTRLAETAAFAGHVDIARSSLGECYENRLGFRLSAPAVVEVVDFGLRNADSNHEIIGG